MTNTTFSPHYVTYKSIEYSLNNNKTIPNCIGKGLYCALPRYDIGILNGKNILIENIRQKCIFNIIKNKYNSTKYKLTEENLKEKNLIYFNYMTNFRENCINKTDSENKFDTECANKVLKIIGLNTDFVEECIEDSYISEDDTKKINTNKIIEEEYYAKSFYHIKILPSILINKKQIASSWNSMNIMEAICAGYNKRHLLCKKILEDFSEQNLNENNDTGVSGMVYFVMILIAILLNGLIFLFCKFYLNRKIERRMEEVDMNGTINSVLSNYLKLRNTPN
jgi:hypothetical protein